MFYLTFLIAILSLGLSSAHLDRDDRLVVGQTFLVNSLDPTDGSNPWALTSHGVAEKLFTVDADGEVVGQVAESTNRISDNVWEVVLKDNYFFSDGSPVTAKDIAGALARQNEKNSGAQSSLGAITATAMGELTVRIETEKVTHIMDSVLAEWAFAVYKMDDGGDYVFTGPFKVVHYKENDHMDLDPNMYYPGAEDRPLIELKKYADGHDLAKDVKRKMVDIGFHLPIDTLSDLRDVEDISVRSFEVGYHYMIHYNMDSMTDKRVRKAIDLSIDRIVLSQALAGGHPTRSLFPDNSPYYQDESDTHGDPDAANLLLKEAGWTLSADGKRQNSSGQTLKVRLVAYPHRPGLVIMQPHIADAMKGLGIEVETILTGMDWAETSKIMNDRTFDMLMWAQHTLPAGDPFWFLHSFFGSDGGNNHANFDSEKVDNLLTQLSEEDDHSNRVFLSGMVQDELREEVPVSNLVTPMWHVSINTDNVKDYEPFGSDYYVIRSDLQADFHGSSASPKVQATTVTVVTMIAGVFTLIW